MLHIIFSLSAATCKKCTDAESYCKSLLFTTTGAVATPVFLNSDCKGHASLLKVITSSWGADLPFPIGRQTDECIIAGRSQMTAEASTICTIEMMKNVVKEGLRQAQIKLVCAALNSALPVISALTAMHEVGAAYYTTGQQTSDGWTIITQRVFVTAKDMMHFLWAAMRSIQPDIFPPASDVSLIC